MFYDFLERLAAVVSVEKFELFTSITSHGYSSNEILCCSRAQQVQNKSSYEGLYELAVLRPSFPSSLGTSYSFLSLALPWTAACNSRLGVLACLMTSTYRAAKSSPIAGTGTKTSAKVNWPRPLVRKASKETSTSPTAMGSPLEAGKTLRLSLPLSLQLTFLRKGAKESNFLLCKVSSLYLVKFAIIWRFNWIFRLSIGSKFFYSFLLSGLPILP